MGKKRTCTNTFEIISWDRVDIVACSCPDKTYLHVHCPCEQCEGKATSRKVELEHWKRSQLLRVKRIKQDESPGGGDSDMKWTGMLVVSLRGVNFGFWSRLGCSGQNVIIFSRQGLV